MIRLFIRFIFCLFAFNLGFAQTHAKFLPADEAFNVKGQILSPTTLKLEWAIAPGYHLYSDSIAIKALSPSNVELLPLTLPQGIPGKEPTRPAGYREYRDHLTIPLQLKKGSTTGLELAVSYQGCADAGLCYPQQTKKISLSEISDDQLSELLENSNDANRIDHLLQQQKLWAVLLSFFVFGLLLAFTPCVFPMLPILSGIIAGQGAHITSFRAFIFSLVYVLSSAATYAFAGIFAGLAGHHLQSTLQNEWTIGFSGIIFIILAMSLFGLYELRLPHVLQNKLAQLSHPKKRGKLVGVAIMGIFSTLIVSPCVSAPLVGALAYIGNSGSAILGGSALFVMGLGMGLPLLIIGASAGKLLPKAGHWMDSIKTFFGIVLIAMAIWLWSRILPAEIILALSGILAINCAIYLGALEPAQKGWPRFWKALGFVLGIYGLCLIVGAASGGSNLFEPLNQLTLTHNSPTPRTETQFTKIKNMAELNNALKKNQPTIVDFSADWCVACNEMKQVFMKPSVENFFKEKNLQLLQVDLTIADPDNQALLKKYNVIAPPSILIFNAHGQWLENNTIVGEQSASNFLKALSEAID
jgi:thiol:disulfide interchange protein DsbD